MLIKSDLLRKSGYKADAGNSVPSAKVLRTSENSPEATRKNDDFKAVHGPRLAVAQRNNSAWKIRRRELLEAP